MIGARVTKDRYTIDPLYQWDKNQVLQIYGLSLPSIPEIHFSNKTMNNAIVKQASMDKAGVVSVDIPNSLLEQSHDILVYICTYEGDAFQCLYKMVIPVYPKKKPDDYITPPDNTDEVYSYKALENLFVNSLALSLDNYEKAKNAYEQAASVVKEQTDAAVSKVGELADEIEKKVEDTLTAAKESGEFKGDPGTPGKDGKDGKDGEDGAPGKDGADGRTPERGVDYWTIDDQSAIVNAVLAALPAAEGVSY